jgi:predicted PurR-regulated permease PerM
LGVVAVLLGLASLYVLRNLLVQFAIAVFIAVSLDPAVRWMIKHRVRRPYAVAIIFTALAAAVVGLVWAFVPAMTSQAGSLISDFPGFVQSLRERSPSLARLEDGLNLGPRVDALARELPGRLAGEAVGFGRQFLGALVSILLVVVLTIYLMLDLPRLRRGLVRLFPKRHRVRVGEVVNLVIDKVGSYMIGNLVISFIAGVTAFVAFILLDVPFALPLALLVAVTDLIPLIGATIGAVVSVVVAVATVDIWPNAVLLAIFFVVYQQLENYLVAPRVLRNSVDMPSIAVLVAALVGASVLGLVGALMAIPIAAVIKVLAAEQLRARDEADAQPDPGLLVVTEERLGAEAEGETVPVDPVNR